MATLKNIETLSGVVVNYWRVCSVDINALQKSVRIRLSGYVNLDLRQNGKSPLDDKYFNVTPKHYDTYFSNEILDNNNPFKQAYKYIKENVPEFKDAVDELSY